VAVAQFLHEGVASDDDLGRPTREKLRLEKVLEDAQIKLDSVISDLLGVSGRKMLNAMISGQRDPRVLADLAHGRMRVKVPQLCQALTGCFDDHHGFLYATMLRRIDTLTANIADLDARIDELITPFIDAVGKIDEIPGIGQRLAQELVAEIGVTMTVFPTAAHLVSWAKFAPIDKQSAGRAKTATTGKGNPWLIRSGHPLPRPRPQLPRHEDQPTATTTRPDPPTRTHHRPESHSPTQARPTRHSLTQPQPEPGSASLRRALPPAHSRTDFESVTHVGHR
jgi:hypothetical protein